MSRRNLTASIVASMVLLGCASQAPGARDFRVQLGGTPPSFPAPVRANGASPRIVAVWFSQPQYRWGELARIDVVASTNVASLEVRVAGYSRGLRRHAYGRFSGVYHVPLLPPFLRPGYRLPFRFVARNAAGAIDTVETRIPVH